MQHVSTRSGCRSNVGSKGELVVECRTQFSSSLGGDYHRVVDGDSTVLCGRTLPWKEKQRGLVEVEFQVVSNDRSQSDRQRSVLLPVFQTNNQHLHFTDYTLSFTLKL